MNYHYKYKPNSVRNEIMKPLYQIIDEEKVPNTFADMDDIRFIDSTDQNSHQFLHTNGAAPCIVTVMQFSCSSQQRSIIGLNHASGAATNINMKAQWQILKDVCEANVEKLLKIEGIDALLAQSLIKFSQESNLELAFEKFIYPEELSSNNIPFETNATALVQEKSDSEESKDDYEQANASTPFKINIDGQTIDINFIPSIITAEYEKSLGLKQADEEISQLYWAFKEGLKDRGLNENEWTVSYVTVLGGHKAVESYQGSATRLQGYREILSNQVTSNFNDDAQMRYKSFICNEACGNAENESINVYSKIISYDQMEIIYERCLESEQNDNNNTVSRRYYICDKNAIYYPVVANDFPPLQSVAPMPKPLDRHVTTNLANTILERDAERTSKEQGKSVDAYNQNILNSFTKKL